MFRLISLLGIVGMLMTFAIGGYAQTDAIADAAEEALEYIAMMPDRVGIACFPIDAPEEGFYLNADETLR